MNQEGRSLERLDERIRRSKRSGKLVLGGVLLVSLVFGVVLVQGLLLAEQGNRGDLVWRAALGLALLLALDLFSLLLIRRQHRRLDEALEEMRELVRLPDPRSSSGP